MGMISVPAPTTMVFGLNVTCVRLVQPLKARTPMKALDCVSSDTKDVHPLNASAPTDVTLAGRTMDLTDSRPSKAWGAMTVVAAHI